MDTTNLVIAKHDLRPKRRNIKILKMADRTEFAVMDKNGIIHQSAVKEDMEIAFNAMQENQEYFSSRDYPEDSYNDYVGEYGTDWEGELKFIEIHEIAW